MTEEGGSKDGGWCQRLEHAWDDGTLETIILMSPRVNQRCLLPNCYYLLPDLIRGYFSAPSRGSRTTTQWRSRSAPGAAHPREFRQSSWECNGEVDHFPMATCIVDDDAARSRRVLGHGGRWCSDGVRPHYLIILIRHPHVAECVPEIPFAPAGHVLRKGCKVQPAKPDHQDRANPERPPSVLAGVLLPPKGPPPPQIGLFTWIHYRSLSIVAAIRTPFTIPYLAFHTSALSHTGPLEKADEPRPKACWRPLTHHLSWDC